MNTKARMKITTSMAGLAVALVLGSGTAHAACAVEDSTVTCSGADNTANEVNTAISPASAPPPDLTLLIAPDGTVIQPGSAITPSSAFEGTVSITNDGQIGTSDALVSIDYENYAASNTNVFDLTNGMNAAIFGHVYALAGNVSIANAGTVTDFIDGIAQAYTSETTDGVTTSGYSGDAVVENSGTVGRTDPATGAFMPGSIYAYGADSASVDNTGAAGLVVASSGADTTTTNGGYVPTTDGTVTTNTYFYETTANEGTASVSIGEGGSASSVSVWNGGTGDTSADIQGTVGSPEAPGSVTVSNDAYDYSYERSYSTDSDNPDYYASRTAYSYDYKGGDSSAVVGPDGMVYGDVSVSTPGGAAGVDVAGSVGGSVSASSTATDYAYEQTSDNNTGTSASRTTMIRTKSGGPALVSIADMAAVGGSVSVRGDESADLSNAGRIGGSVNVASARPGVRTFEEQTSTTASSTADDGTTTYDSTSTFQYVDETLGGAASFTNGAGAIVEGSTSVTGATDASLASEGHLIGNVSVTAAGTRMEYENVYTYSSVTTPASGSGNGNGNGNGMAATAMLAAAADPYTADTTDTTLTSSTATGGVASGTYAGSVGAVQFIDSNGVAANVSQYGQAGSTADISGVIIGSFGGAAGASNSETSNVETRHTVFDGTDTALDYTRSYESSSEQIAASSTATVSGRITNDAYNATGNLTLESSGGDATLLVDGGTIEGNAGLSAGGTNSTYASELEQSWLNGVEQSETYSTASTSTAVPGMASATLIGATLGDVEDETGGNLTVNGSGGAMASIDGDSEVVGSVSLSAFGSNSESTFTRTAMRVDDDTVDRTEERSSSTTHVGGDALAEVDGLVHGSVTADSGAGNTTVNLTGQALQGVYAYTGGTDTTYSSTSVFSNGSFTSTGYDTMESMSTNRKVGGVATVTIASNPDIAGANLPAVETGSIVAAGRAGSYVTIGEGTRVLTGNQETGVPPGGYIGVGGWQYNPNVGEYGFWDRTSTSFEDNSGAGSSITTVDEVMVDGPSMFLNNGTVGAPGESLDFYDGSVWVDVFGTSGAEATNNGSIFGDVSVDGTGLNFSSVTEVTGTLDPVLRTEVITRTYTPVGGDATLLNNGLITGDAEIYGGNSVLTNNGVIRGTIYSGIYLPNYTTTQTDTAFSAGEETLLSQGDPFVQDILIDQNGVAAGGVSIFGAYDDYDPEDRLAEMPTSTINATINLNNGSVTGTGVFAEQNEDGSFATNTMLNLNGSGYFGLALSDDGTEALSVLSPYGSIDPYLSQENLSTLMSMGNNVFGLGVSVRGVEQITKTGDGTFIITGTAYDENADGTPPLPAWTFDIGSFVINGGEVQLDVVGSSYDLYNYGEYGNGYSGFAVTGSMDLEAPVFGIRGDVENNATLVLGRRVELPQSLFLNNLVAPGTEVIAGIEIFQEGNFTQSEGGTLVVGVAPTLARSTQTEVTPGVSRGLFGTSFTGVALAPFTTAENSNVPFSTPSFVELDGDLSLAGTVNLATTRGAIYVGGTSTDLFSVSGDVDYSGATVTDGLGSSFVSFGLTDYAEGDMTKVAIEVVRTPYASVAADANSAAAADGLDAALPGIVDMLTTDAAGGAAFSTVEEFSAVQDVATVIAAFDTQLSNAQVTEGLRELSSGAYYGSLLATRTTDPFGDFTRQAPVSVGSGSFNLWLSPNGNFAKYSANDSAGASGLRADLYGGSVGLGVTTSAGGEYGVGFGYGRVDTSARGTPEKAKANTYMVGAFARQAFGQAHVAAQVVFGWSNWEATRDMPLFSRTATADFDSKETRFILQGGYDFPIGMNVVATPFARVDLRHYSFDGFTEEGAGGIGLDVQSRSKTVLSPELGVKVAGDFETGLATLRPELSVSYTFQGDVGARRNVAYLGDTSSVFRLEGVDPDGFFTIGAGLGAAIGERSTVFVRGSYSTGGGVKDANVGAGVKIGF